MVAVGVGSSVSTVETLAMFVRTIRGCCVALWRTEKEKNK